MHPLNHPVVQTPLDFDEKKQTRIGQGGELTGREMKHGWPKSVDPLCILQNRVANDYASIKEDGSADACKVAARGEDTGGPGTSRKQWRQGLVRGDRLETKHLSCGQFRERNSSRCRQEKDRSERHADFGPVSRFPGWALHWGGPLHAWHVIVHSLLYRKGKGRET